MRNCNRKINLALLALIAAGLLAVPPETQAQAPPEVPENNFAWITDTNGITRREKISPPDYDREADGSPRISGGAFWGLALRVSKDKSIAEIVVPEHALIAEIFAYECVNLTNIILKTNQGGGHFFYRIEEDRHVHDGARFELRPTRLLDIDARHSGLENITCSKTMRDHIYLRRTVRWWPIQWTELKPEPPKIKIKTHTTANGKEMEIVWGTGTLQIADAVNGQWRDYSGNSPLRFPLWFRAKDKQFFRIRRSR